jgi:hypothetical protein
VSNNCIYNARAFWFPRVSSLSPLIATAEDGVRCALKMCVPNLAVYSDVLVWMFRLGFGGLVPWWIMLTTVERKSGKPRRAVVDIVQRNGDKA